MTEFQSDLVTKDSAWSVTETVERFSAALSSHGMTIFAVIDQRAAAIQVGEDLRETVLIIFGNPASGTPIMNVVPLAGLDLPLKLLVWNDDGQTRVSYLSPAASGTRYQLPEVLISPLTGIDKLTDAVLF